MHEEKTGGKKNLRDEQAGIIKQPDQKSRDVSLAITKNYSLIRTDTEKKNKMRERNQKEKSERNKEARVDQKEKERNASRAAGKKLPLRDRSARMKRQLIDRRAAEDGEGEITFYHRILFHGLKSFGEKRRRAGGFIDGISSSRRTFEESSRDFASQWTEGGTRTAKGGIKRRVRGNTRTLKVRERKREEGGEGERKREQTREKGGGVVARAREEIDGR